MCLAASAQGSLLNSKSQLSPPNALKTSSGRASGGGGCGGWALPPEQQAGDFVSSGNSGHSSEIHGDEYTYFERVAGGGD